MKKKGWLTISEAAKLAKKSSRTIRRYVDAERKLNGGGFKVKGVCKYVKGKNNQVGLLVKKTWIKSVFQDKDYQKLLNEIRRKSTEHHPAEKETSKGKEKETAPKEDRPQTNKIPENRIADLEQEVKRLNEYALKQKDEYINGLKERIEELKEERVKMFAFQKELISKYESIVSSYRTDMRYLMDKYESLSLDMMNMLPSSEKQTIRLGTEVDKEANEQEEIEAKNMEEEDKRARASAPKTFADFLQSKK